ncbi:PROTEIN UPSTREAM OF FLC-LIKE ISOFORM X1 [Salix purpurea]|uniref:PROTEIN UPSTREAM OF FLC-LIKE ISOFORM X1 n=1 Tax=Salix purpurea TaxID=77065 RepID=A0A9Q0TU91_SALPP|nr:PROTEIN UPSTREAM OF FLC-LIKE ISOFORM X1 [Salix purpurea]
MAADSADRRELLTPTKYQDRENNPERTKMLNPPKSKSEQKVGVVYYLTRNGKFEHPHFMEVHLSSPRGLQLKDVTERINHLRGQGMANLYSWSSKRRYKNGFVWQDLSETDYIQPCHGHEYILKGSLLLESSLSLRSQSTTSSRTSKVFSDIIINSSEGSNSPVNRRTSRSWTTFDEVDEYKVHRAKITGEIASMGASNVSKHTIDRRRVNIDGNEELGHELLAAIEPSREESSKLSLKSSSKALERLETSVEANSSSGTLTCQTVGNDCPSGRMKPSMVMMKLIGCGSKMFSDKD